MHTKIRSLSCFAQSRTSSATHRRLSQFSGPIRLLATPADPNNISLPPSFSMPKISQDHRRAQKEFSARIRDAVQREPAFSWPYFEVACRLGISDSESCAQILSVPQNQIPERVAYAFEFLSRNKLEISPAVYNMAVVSFARLGKLEEMKHVLVEMQSKKIGITADTHNDILLHLTKANKLDDAVSVLNTLMNSNVLPNTTFTSMLLEALIEAKLDHQVVHVLRLLRPLGRRALLEAANLVLQLYQRGQNWQRAPDVIYELDAMQIPPDEQLLNSVLAIAVHHRRLPHALQVLRRMGELHMRPAPKLVQTVVTILLRQYDFAAASLIILQMPTWGQSPSASMYQRALLGIADSKPRRALQLLEAMLPRRIVPEVESTARTLRSLVKHNFQTEVQKLLSLLLQPEFRTLWTVDHVLTTIEAISQLSAEWQSALSVSVAGMDVHKLLHELSAKSK